MRPFLVVVAALLGLAVAVNGLATWERARHEARIARAAAAFRPGQALLGYRDTDERRFQKARLAAIPPPRVVAFGSSRVMTLSTAMVGAAPGEFYNAGLSGGTVEDFIVLWTTLRDAGKVPQVAVFAIDNWEFNAAHPRVRWLTWAGDVTRFVEATEGAAWWSRADAVLYRWYQLKDLASYSVLTTSFTDLARRLRGREARGAEIVRTLGERLVDERSIDGRRALRADGSLVYEAEYRARGPAEVRVDALDFALKDHGGLREFAWDAERARRLALLWRDMRAHGVRVVAYLPPYHPLVWGTLQKDPRAMAGLARTRAVLDDLAARHGARVLDFSDPASVPCAEAEFLDGNHARAPCLTRLLARVRAAGY
ncbi:MAG TPA: hypothetical protein VGT02_10900 [Methylomirabilota bacterium]|nr:hypothetical protein [Methylomirabilota bacterium]